MAEEVAARISDRHLDADYANDNDEEFTVVPSGADDAIAAWHVHSDVQAEDRDVYATMAPTAVATTQPLASVAEAPAGRSTATMPPHSLLALGAKSDAAEDEGATAKVAVVPAQVASPAPRLPTPPLAREPARLYPLMDKEELPMGIAVAHSTEAERLAPPGRRYSHDFSPLSDDGSQDHGIGDHDGDWLLIRSGDQTPVMTPTQMTTGATGVAIMSITSSAGLCAVHVTSWLCMAAYELIPSQDLMVEAASATAATAVRLIGVTAYATQRGTSAIVNWASVDNWVTQTCAYLARQATLSGIRELGASVGGAITGTTYLLLSGRAAGPVGTFLANAAGAFLGGSVARLLYLVTPATSQA